MLMLAQNSNFSVFELTSGQQLKTVAVDTSICPANSVRWLNLRNGSTTGLPNNNSLYGMARVNRRNANIIQITTLADNGESFESHSADGGTTWSEWYSKISSLDISGTISNGTNTITVTKASFVIFVFRGNTGKYYVGFCSDGYITMPSSLRSDNDVSMSISGATLTITSSYQYDLRYRIIEV